MPESVISCVPSKEWTNPKSGNKVQIYAVGLSDGRGGQSFGKDIPIGTPVSDLLIEDKGQYGLDFKLKSAGGQAWSGGGKQRGGNESFALSYAKDLVVAGKVDIKQILPIADKLYDWLEGKKPAKSAVPAPAPVPAPQPYRAPMTTTPAPSPSSGPTDDLPF